MREAELPGFEWTADLDMFGAPALALSMWSPLFYWCAVKWIVQLYAGFGTSAKNSKCRLREDFALMQCVAHGRTPDQIGELDGVVNLWLFPMRSCEL